MSVPNAEEKPPGGSPATNAAAVKGDARASTTTQKCESCGSTSIDVDPGRAEAVCTNCGDVLDTSLIVSDVQFQENQYGGASAVGQFVHSDSKGGGGFSGSGDSFGKGGFGGGRGLQSVAGLGRESREITLRNARSKIKALGQQLQIRQDRIEMAYNFFRMALCRNLTRGRKSTHVIAACVYITCRTEGTSHMLIDFSDVLQIDVYELGRTYLRLSQELCINIPAMDPCLYVMRFAHKLEFGEKTHEVSMTALRLVSRMKKDWMHFGRRPSGLCGAALLIAARLHRFNRTVADVIKVVKVHESTLRKRLSEFGETPASQLTLDEFMSVDLDAMTEEQDPPSFKAARRRDRERLAALEEECDVDEEISELEREIEKELAERRAKRKGPYAKMAAEVALGVNTSEEVTSERTDDGEAEKFIAAETLGTIAELVTGEDRNKKSSVVTDQRLMPPPPPAPAIRGIIDSPGLGLKDTIEEYLTPASSEQCTPFTGKKEEAPDGEDDDGEDLDLTSIDDAEIDSYLLSESEVKLKTAMWTRVNAEYLKEKAEKEERERKEEEEAAKEGRELKRKRPRGRPATTEAKKAKVNLGGNATAIEAIEKIAAEKKISTKINYDVLRSLSSTLIGSPNGPLASPKVEAASSPSGLLNTSKTSDDLEKETVPGQSEAAVVEKEKTLEDSEPIIESGPVARTTGDDELEEDLVEDDEDETCMSAAELLSKHRGDNSDEEYYEEDY